MSRPSSRSHRFRVFGRKARSAQARRIRSRLPRWGNVGLEPLEARVLLSTSLLHWSPPVDAAFAAESAVVAAPSESATAPYALADTFQLHSNPGAEHVVYLDFDGHVTAGTPWNTSYNGGADFVTPAYDYDGNVGSFSSGELERIQYIYQRVAEDFIPFDVDITTEEPALDDLMLTGAGDTRWGVRVAIGGSSGDWFGTPAGGVAYYNSFNWNNDTPTFVFEAQLGNGNEKYTAEAISHEVGHTLNLRHDGNASTEYYQGHGSGATGWAPILGVGYYKELVQWSRGEYSGASNLEDDLAIITTNNGFDYRADDYGSDFGSASLLMFDGGAVAQTGIIERNTDDDVFAFQTGPGEIQLDIDAAARSSNLDVLAELYDDSYALIASSNPADVLDAGIIATVGGGSYFLRVTGTGKGDPSGGGYSDYGSLGQYSISGLIADPGLLVSVNDVTVDEADGAALFTVSLSGPSAAAVTVDVATVDGTAAAGSDYVATATTVTFAPGETTQVVAVPILDDATTESTETFVLQLSNADGVTIADDQGVGTILDDEVFVSVADATIREGDPAKGKKQTVKTSDMVFTISLSGSSATPVTVSYATADDTALAGADYFAASGLLTFNPGEVSKTVTVAVIGDSVVEGDETLILSIADATNAAVADGTAVGTIQDNDSSGGGKGNGRDKKNGGSPKRGPAFGSDTVAFGAALDLLRSQHSRLSGPTFAPPQVSHLDGLDAEGQEDSADSLLSRLLDVGATLREVG